MSTPIKAKHFEKDFASSDEEALYIAVEAIINDEFERLPFSKSANVYELRSNITNDSSYDEIEKTISNQKLLLNSFISNRPVENNLQKITELQNKAMEAIENESKDSNSMYKKLSVAASVLVVCLVSVLGISYALNKNNTDINSVKSSNKLSDMKASSSPNSATSPVAGSDANNGVVSRDNANLPTSELTTNSVTSSKSFTATTADETITTTPKNNVKHLIETALFLVFLLLLLVIRAILKKTKIED